VSYLQTAVAPRLFGVADNSYSQGIFTAASALTEMAGWMAHDAGRDDVAQQHFRRSLDLAVVGGDGELIAHVLASLSHLALHRGEPNDAISLACRGQEVLAKTSSNPALGARLLAMQARGLAAQPQRDAASAGKTLLRAERALDRDQAESPSPWISGFDDGSLASEAARMLRQLGQFDAAARHARRIIDLRPGDHARSRAFGQLLLADALVAKGEIEEACAAGRKALEAAQSLSSYLVVQHVHRLADSLQPYRANQAADDYLTAVGHAAADRLWPVPGEPSAGTV
jgi:tetratricopeptide (TPR) repeat protein